jgi:hypothetical protein
MEQVHKPVWEHQRRLNNVMSEVVKKEVLNLLKARVIYPLSSSEWVEALPCRAIDVVHSKRMFHEVIFLRYGVPRIVISDGGPHFIDQTF